MHNIYRTTHGMESNKTGSGRASIHPAKYSYATYLPGVPHMKESPGKEGCYAEKMLHDRKQDPRPLPAGQFSSYVKAVLPCLFKYQVDA